jgi:hypothetical protein
LASAKNSQEKIILVGKVLLGVEKLLLREHRVWRYPNYLETTNYALCIQTA